MFTPIADHSIRSQTMNRAFTNVLSQDVEKTALFYEELLGMTRSGDFGWFILLGHENMPGFEFGILDEKHETIPAGIGMRPAGGSIITFVVEDLEPVYEKARAMKADIVQEPTDLPYGQRRLMLRDPAGTIIDVSSPIR